MVWGSCEEILGSFGGFGDPLGGFRTLWGILGPFKGDLGSFRGYLDPSEGTLGFFLGSFRDDLGSPFEFPPQSPLFRTAPAGRRHLVHGGRHLAYGGRSGVGILQGVLGSFRRDIGIP